METEIVRHASGFGPESAANYGLGIVLSIALAAAFYFLLRSVLKTNNERELRYHDMLNGSCLAMTKALQDLNDKSSGRHTETHKVIKEDGDHTRSVVRERLA